MDKKPFDWSGTAVILMFVGLILLGFGLYFFR